MTAKIESSMLAVASLIFGCSNIRLSGFCG